MSNSVAIVGASGYSGAELIRILHAHPKFELAEIFAHSAKGEKLSTVHPQFSGINMEFRDTAELKLNDYDLIFFALPAGLSGALLKDQELKKHYVDLGADFRLLSKQDWQNFYPGKYSGVWTYGLPELVDQRNLIKKSKKIANPGCYATAANLGLLPAVVNKLLANSFINIVAASGTTGAGKSLKSNLLNSEANNNLSPYKVGGVHQHIPEIEQTLLQTTNDTFKISFLPILAPMPRGILLTATFETDKSLDDIQEVYLDYYKNEYFAKVLDQVQLPNTRALIGSNNAHISITKDIRTNQAQVIVAIDNLGKGAAGQAVQNANLMFDYEEQTGLTQIGIGS